jgi:hypothetical protein
MHRNKVMVMTSALKMAFSLCLMASAWPTLDERNVLHWVGTKGNASNNKQMKELICSKPLTFDVWGKIIDKLNNVFKGKFPFWVAFLVSFCRLGAAAIVKRFATIFLLVGIQIAWFATIIK